MMKEKCHKCGHERRVMPYRDERFVFGFVTGLLIAALAGFIIVSDLAPRTRSGTAEVQGAPSQPPVVAPMEK